jgi:hypothetical protein
MSHLPITTYINGRAYDREAVLAWEARRAARVARRLGLAPTASELGRRIVERKLELGHDALRAQLRRELRVSAVASELGARVSRGRRAVATTVLTCDGGAAELVPAWYRAAFTANDGPAMLAASPDHWLFHHHAPGADEVIETTGNSPAVVQMFFDDERLETIRTPADPADPAFPVAWAGVARSARGTAVGGIQHLFRDEPNGFYVCLNVEFPVMVRGPLSTAHCWHLAGEFSNWIEFANGIRDPAGG